MTHDPYRLLRLLAEGLASSSPEPRPRRGPPPRFLGRVLDGGAMPADPGRFVLMHPVRLGGAEAEGLAATTAVDGARPIPVLWLGPKTPAVGDLAVAHSAGGRWVVDRLGASTTVSCGGCEIPRANLTMSWTNSLLGPRSTTLVYDGVAAWTSACINQLAFRLNCASGSPTFSATYFTGGPCPSGSPNSCTSPGSSPLGLTLTLATCTPFLRRYSTTGCPALTSQGYTSFTITE